MKDLLVSYATYNTWANDQMLAVIRPLGEERQRQTIVSSFSSLFATTLHLLDAGSIWWQRLRLQEQLLIPSASFNGDFDALSLMLQRQDRQWEEWVKGATQARLEHAFKYQNTKRESFTRPVYEVLLHLFNHATYHRGQLVTMLRQLEVQKIPQTDFIAWGKKR